MKQKTSAAIEHLSTALATYDVCKANHAETTSELKDAKDAVDLAARAVVDAENGAIDLFEAAEEAAPAEAKPRGRRRTAPVGAAAP